MTSLTAFFLNGKTANVTTDGVALFAPKAKRILG